MGHPLAIKSSDAKIGKPIAEGIIEGIKDGNIPSAFRGVLEKARDALKRVKGFIATGKDAAWGFLKGWWMRASPAR